MTRTSLSNVNCSLAQALDIVGDKWALMIIRDAFYGVRTFSSFQRRLGVARNILTSRLNTLVEGGVLEKVQRKTEGERLVYQLTTQGKELFPTLVALVQWGDKWVTGPGKEPVRIIDALTLSPVSNVCVSSRDGRFVEASDVRFAAGPGATDDTRAQFALAERRAHGLDERPSPS